MHNLERLGIDIQYVDNRLFFLREKIELIRGELAVIMRVLLGVEPLILLLCEWLYQVFEGLG